MRLLFRLTMLVVLAGIAWHYAEVYQLVEPVSRDEDLGGLLGRFASLAGTLLAGGQSLPAPFGLILTILAWLIAAVCLIALVRVVLWLLKEIRDSID